MSEGSVPAVHSPDVRKYVPLTAKECLSRPSSARIHKFLLGDRRDSYLLDREAAQSALVDAPFLAGDARDQKLVLERQVTNLAASGIRQFVDLGCGLPYKPYLHETITQVCLDARVVYVDQDPVVVAHAAAFMDGQPPAVVEHLTADITLPETVLSCPKLLQTIDLRQPVAFVLGSVLPYIADTPQQPLTDVLDQYKAAAAPGSALVLTHLTADFAQDRMNRVAESFTRAGLPTYLRTHREIAALLDGWQLQPPSVATSQTFLMPRPRRKISASYAAVALKPERTC